MRYIGRTDFTVPIKVESEGRTSTELFDNTMRFFRSDCGSRGLIEWKYHNGHSQGEDEIYLAFEGDILSSFEGVLSLPEEACDLLATCGIEVPEEYCKF